MSISAGNILDKFPIPRELAITTSPWSRTNGIIFPSGSDPVCGIPLTPDILQNHSVWKARYFQYTDATFTKRAPQTPRLGILGPVLRGVVGEYLEVTFLNREIGGTYSMHPHGVKYDKDSEGSYHSDFADKAASRNGTNSDGTSTFQGRGAAIGYNARFTYVWYLDESSGPLPSEPSSKALLYHSHVNAESEANAGLEGFIIVTDPKRARPDGTPIDVDREMSALFMIYDESGLNAEAQEQLAASGNSETWVNFQKMKEAGQRHAINGYIYGNLPGLEMNEGERVRWYLFGLGSENDQHTAHWHGLRVMDEGRRRTDTVELLPGQHESRRYDCGQPGPMAVPLPRRRAHGQRNVRPRHRLSHQHPRRQPRAGESLLWPSRPHNNDVNVPRLPFSAGNGVRLWYENANRQFPWTKARRILGSKGRW